MNPSNDDFNKEKIIPMLLKTLQVWKDEFSITCVQDKDKAYHIILEDKSPPLYERISRKIVLIIFFDIPRYSITAFELNRDELGNESLDQVFSLEVKGECQVDSIVENLNKVIQDREDIHHYLKYPHR